MYLEIKEGSSSKQYTLTDSYAKPYIKVSNQSVLPLTTNTTQGLQLKVSIGGSTMRGMEFNTMSTSVTYYSSAANPGIMSSTTALTRQSTSSTSYLTRPSTSGESYITRPSTSGTSYLTAKGNWHWGVHTSSVSYTDRDVWHQALSLFMGAHNSYTTFSSASYEFAHEYPVYQEGYYSSRNYWYGSVENHVLSQTVKSIYGTHQGIMSWSGWTVTTTENYYQTTELTRTSSTLTQTIYEPISRLSWNLQDIWSEGGTYDTEYYSWGNGTYQTGYVEYVLNSRSTQYQSSATSDYRRITRDPNWSVRMSQYYTWYNRELMGPAYSGYSFTRQSVFDVNVSTTGTQFLTRASTYSTSYLTRPSTSQTSYLTRGSTSGYSGVSSSSSSSQGWQ